MDKNATHNTISYTDAFFYSITDEVMIADTSEEERRNIAIVYNSFKNILEMDNDSNIVLSREKMLALEYFQIFMSIMHGMHRYYRYRMRDSDPSNDGVPTSECIRFSFNMILESFCKHTYAVRNFPKDEKTWDEMEIDLLHVLGQSDGLLNLIHNYCYEEDNSQLSPPPAEISIDPPKKVIKMPDSYFKEDQEPKTDEEKFEEQKLFQAMEISRMNWAVERIMIIVHTTVNICVAVVFAFMFARIWCFLGSIENKDKYKLDDGELGGIFLALTIIIILNNIKTINKWIKELVNNG